MKNLLQAVSGIFAGLLVMMGAFFAALMLLATADGWWGFATHPVQGSIPSAVVALVAVGFFVRVRETMLNITGGAAWAQRIVWGILLLPILACLTLWFGMDWEF